MRVWLFFLSVTVALTGLGRGLLHAAYTVDIYMVDVGHGNAVFVVSPSGETMLIDTGNRNVAGRLAAFMQHAGLKQIDYLTISHFEPDHMGAAAPLAEKVPVKAFVDHGDSVFYHRDQQWWKQRRGPWFRADMNTVYDAQFDAYLQARQKARHIVVKPGDRVPMKGLDTLVVSAAGKALTRPLKGQGRPNPACASVDRRADDDAEDGQSVGLLISYGKFRFINLGDLTWNTANSLFCPNNLLGTVDAYVVTHHAQSTTNQHGDYYFGLSCCSAGEVHGLRPRVALLTMGASGHKEGTPAAMKVVRNSPGLEDMWQTQKIIGGGEAGYNAPDDFIANVGGQNRNVEYIKLSASQDGSFTVTNSRNGFTKKYPARK
ncbi:MAG: ComEC/Rec2 family competence protein [Bryobacteraceae bacterium]